MATSGFRAPKGTNDILPPMSKEWALVMAIAQTHFGNAGYDPVETPLFEHTEVFERGVGEGTEVVTKQMYTFQDQGGRSLTLRPEGTAPVVRAVLEHNLHRGPLPVKLSYGGPFFRQERPQKGRYRQFFQLGIEAIGADDPRVDAEVIQVGYYFLQIVRVEPTLLLNSIGHQDDSCRLGYLATLTSWLEDHAEELDPADRDRVRTNPLRTFDSKETKTVEAMRAAPVITDHLCGDCRAHFETVQSLLTDLGVDFTLDPTLVRGLDYYTRTAFEFVAGGLGSQSAVGGGGRYDGLSESLGGPPLPGIGFALGVDRILIASSGVMPDAVGSSSLYVVSQGEAGAREALKLATELRVHGYRVELDLMGRGMKGQMKDADRSGAGWAIIVGDTEIDRGEVVLKDLGSGEQEAAPRESRALVHHLREKQLAALPGELEERWQTMMKEQMTKFRSMTRSELEEALRHMDEEERSP